MPSYSVSYDLRAPGRNYQSLWDALRNAGAVRALESLWLLDDPKNAAGVRDAMRSHVDENDRILVTQLLPGMNWASTNLMPGATEWLKARFP